MREIEKFFNSFKFNISKKDIVKNNFNEYVSLDLEGLFYIRNFCNQNTHVDIDEYFSSNEIFSYSKNAFENKKKLISNLNYKKYQYFSSAVILCSSSKINNELLKNNLIIGINNSLYEYAEQMHIYMSNNPNINNQCFPKNNISKWPEGLFAYRINPNFIKLYKGSINGFNIPKNSNKSGLFNVNNYNFYLEDHRSIILSAFNLCYYLGIRNVILINFENYLKEEKPGSVYIKEGIYMYPQQIIDLSIINAGAYWLNNYNINVFTTNKFIDFTSNIKHIDESKIISG